MKKSLAHNARKTVELRHGFTQKNGSGGLIFRSDKRLVKRKILPALNVMSVNDAYESIVYTLVSDDSEIVFIRLIVHYDVGGTYYNVIYIQPITRVLLAAG